MFLSQEIKKTGGTVSLLSRLQEMFTLPSNQHGYKMAAILRSITPRGLIAQLIQIATDKVTTISEDSRFASTTFVFFQVDIFH